MKKENMVVAGKLHSTHGVKGNLKLELFHEKIRLPNIVYIEDEETKELVPLEIEFIDRVKKLIMFKGYDTPEKAKEISQKLIYIPQENLPKLNENEYYIFQLEGCEVIFKDKVVGKVEKVDDRLPQIYLIIKCTDDKTRYLPFINQFVENVDIENKKITVTPPEGWFTL
ncbi:ribosome maturation factor RimM [Sulfurihydrogenibium subterraneum]|uniref:ribosome maturation factor RimM n=1 Tax=Sulfurihydrogenibium subterraneum TaxID=171121 RepID=UPI000490DEA6|nr:ribosome maturation factor RimM [Sulfurihydrogenibium subterraneum]